MELIIGFIAVLAGMAAKGAQKGMTRPGAKPGGVGFEKPEAGDILPPAPTNGREPFDPIANDVGVSKPTGNDTVQAGGNVMPTGGVFGRSI